MKDDGLKTAFDEEMKNGGMLLSMLENESSEEQRAGVFHLACRMASPGVVRKMLESNPWLAVSKRKSGEYPVHSAAEGGSEETIRLLLSFGADMEERDEGGRTPFLAACRSLNREKMEFLLGQGANGEARDKMGRSASDIILSSVWSDTEKTETSKASICLAVLFEKKTGLSKGLLKQAAERGDPCCIEVVWKNAKKGFSEAEIGEALCGAVWWGRKTGLAKLLDLGASPESRNEEGVLSLEKALLAGEEECASLLAKRATKTLKDSKGRNFSETADENEMPDLAAWLRERELADSEASLLSAEALPSRKKKARPI